MQTRHLSVNPFSRGAGFVNSTRLTTVTRPHFERQIPPGVIAHK